MEQIPEPYLIWVLQNISDLEPDMRKAIRSRLGLPEQPVACDVIEQDLRDKIVRRFGRRMRVDYSDGVVQVGEAVLKNVLDGLDR